MNNNYGQLHIVATPIGNLEDITIRAIRILKEVDFICAEDTRNTIKLLNHFDIRTKMISYHEHNKYDKAIEIIKLLKDNKNVAIVTDAGTPIISDPGFELVDMCYKERINVTSIPGASALICAVTLSGINSDEFLFIGFLSANKKDKKNKLLELKNEKHTMIFYISPHKLLSTLEDLINTFSKNRFASISREMTKIHEETIRGSLEYIYNYFSNKEIKGEFVIVIKGNDEEEVIYNKPIKTEYNELLNQGLSDKEAMKKISLDRKIDKRIVYKEVKQINGDNNENSRDTKSYTT
ncbi:MAG: 16S rRNA (cytidine(1402)-2'-O)-methyltransferase [Eubacteriales bacterium]|nr:16S rRNA (cytidine(1402)-2'-O)-methyltransferase [Eubacteriales bacterium]